MQTSILGNEGRISIDGATGRVREDTTLTTPDGMLLVTFSEGSLLLDIDGRPLTLFEMHIEPEGSEEVPPLPESTVTIGSVYDFHPHGASFNPPIILQWRYSDEDIPEGIIEEDLYIGSADNSGEGGWEELACEVDTENNVIQASVHHHTIFALLGPIAPPAAESTPESTLPPTPAAFSASGLRIQPAEAQPNEIVAITVSVANTGGSEGSYALALVINGVAVASKIATIAGADSLDVPFSLTRKLAGTYSVSVAGLSGSFIVVAPVPQEEEEEIAPASEPARQVIEAEVRVEEAPASQPEQEGIFDLNRWWLGALIGAAAVVGAGLILVMRRVG